MQRNCSRGLEGASFGRVEEIFSMKVGVVFPQTEIGNNPAEIATLARAAEDMGYDYVVAYDHVLGVVPRGPDWKGYTHKDMFHEPFVLFGYLAAITRRLELTNGILVLPQRQTALVAKQAAEVDVLSGGRLRLGVGVGWNSAEFEAMGEDFHSRGARIEEQVAVLRALWTHDVVTFEGRWHRIVEAGINPLPVQRPIPIWMGGESDTVLRRVARLADGWMAGGTLRTPTSRLPGVPGGYPAMVDRLREYARHAGRPPAAIGLERRINAGDPPQEWTRAASEWHALGGTHLSVNTMRMGLRSPQDHIETFGRVREALTHAGIV
jgi:probable F420-dependent oxidoreductase